MKRRFDKVTSIESDDLCNRIIGLGENSGRKSYFPELKRKLEELLHARTQADNANRAKTEFLATMSHEIRTPLHTILGFAEVLAGSSLTPDQKKCVAKIDKAGSQLLLTINDILDLSRIEAGKIHLEKTGFSYIQIIEEVTDILCKWANKKNLQFQLHVDPAVPRHLYGDPLRLRQIFMNIASNAIKFTAEGKISVNVRAHHREGNMHFIECSVSDTGIGIPGERIPSLFQRFSQVDSTVTRQFGGSGLGLAICKELVELMGGSIEVRSVVKKGSIFLFTIPFSSQGEVGSKTKEIADVRTDDGKASEASNLDILVVEDSLENQLLIEKFLDGFPWHLDFAKDGKEAIELFKKRKFDVILMDMEMPVLDGYSTTRTIRSLEADRRLQRTPILAQTAHALSVKIDESMNAGCDMHLSKPIKRIDLIKAILQCARLANAPVSRAKKP
ncbi:MAG: hybrid sensor histidine kinase/response regulator [Bdellovibrio sp.]|nr:MAG: hybrid sensor histidine kinase/response regulator [Bdellovibrio sp.]